MFGFEGEPCTLCGSQDTTKFCRIENEGTGEMRGLLICDPCIKIIEKYLDWYRKVKVYQKEKK